MSTKIKDLLQPLTDGVEGFTNAAKSVEDHKLVKDDEHETIQR